MLPRIQSHVYGIPRTKEALLFNPATKKGGVALLHQRADRPNKKSVKGVRTENLY